MPDSLQAADRIIAELRHDLDEQRTLKENAEAAASLFINKLVAKDAEIAAAAETLRLSQLQYKLVTERSEKSSQENERLRAALEDILDRFDVTTVTTRALSYEYQVGDYEAYQRAREALAVIPPVKPVCPTCKGEGFIVAPGQENLPPWQLPLSDKCPTCDGTGRIPPEAPPSQSAKPA